MNYTTEIEWLEGCIEVLQDDREKVMEEMGAAIDRLIILKATLHGKKLAEDAKIKIGVQD